MTARRLIGLALVLCAAGVLAYVLLTTPKKVGVEGPAPFTAHLPFREPPVIHSRRAPGSRDGRLKVTLIAKNGTVRASGVKIANTQTYAVRAGGATTVRGILGPTLAVNPGDTIDVTLDNELVAPKNLAPKTPSVLDCSGAEHGSSHAARPATTGQQLTNLHFHGLHVTPRTRLVGGAKVYGDNV